ncbi:hypothetical protein HYH02_008658 [Chlamydomonas schloesseri]|uniref:N-acetyltransferase domain-containing protein n=1 Tax=Chlamydomonas schloesseri TaxID=2026947 RepID=A0A836B1T4_9CHLO|nr:hypothetical protein HYH02_008658 [Chlamydomonas schloesseri]|eukprot:KAG2445190.1 hypothetical protein HYH02_008658 [Chlamydomonas schloesseri]
MVASMSVEEQPRVVSLGLASALQLSRAAVCFGASMVEDPVLLWATDGKQPASSVAFYTKMAEVFFNAMGDRSWCWALEAPPQANALPGDLDAHTPQSVCLACEVPRAYPSDWQLLCAGMLGLGLSCPSWRCVRMFVYLTPEFQKRHKAYHQAHGPFVYIAAFGTRPKLWGRGRGSQLMSAVLQHADARGMHCYLEASSADSRRFYARHGFALLEEMCVLPPTAADAATAPLLYIMARPPRGAGGAGGGGGGRDDVEQTAGPGAGEAGALVAMAATDGDAAGPKAVAAAAPAASTKQPPQPQPQQEQEQQTAAAAAGSGQAEKAARQGDEQV